MASCLTLPTQLFCKYVNSTHLSPTTTHFKVSITMMKYEVCLLPCSCYLSLKTDTVTSSRALGQAAPITSVARWCDQNYARQSFKKC